MIRIAFFLLLYIYYTQKIFHSLIIAILHNSEILSQIYNGTSQPKQALYQSDARSAKMLASNAKVCYNDLTLDHDSEYENNQIIINR